MFTLPIAVTSLIVATSILTVEGFSISSRTVALSPSSPLSTRAHQSFSRTSGSLSVLTNQSNDCSNDDSAESEKRMVQVGMKKFQGIIKRGTNQYISQVVRFWMKSRRPLLAICAACLFWFGAAGTHTPVSHGSSAVASSTPTAAISRNFNILSPSLDTIVDGYVKDHMFDDDVYDPVESIYKEAMDDRVKGTYPRDLKETASSVLGQNAMKAEKKASGTGFGGMLVKATGFLRQKGLSEMQAIALITGTFVFGGPSIAFAGFMVIVNQNKRSMNKLMKDRYGDTYTVDASDKEEDDVDFPDEDDDDDGDDDDDDDDDE